MGGIVTIWGGLARSSARVAGVCSAVKAEMVRSIGGDRVVDYTREDFAESDERCDVILDIGGN